jgi:hypothetical protein
MRSGSVMARLTMLIPICSSSFGLDLVERCGATRQRNSAAGDNAFSTAARVACIASSTRAFFSFISVSVAAPTLITATPPTSFANRSCNFSRS